MKILQVNKFYYPRGGADKYFLWLSEALEKAGHQVAVFSMDHPKNIKTSWSSYFVSRISFNEGGFKNKLKTPGRVIYSFATKKKFNRLIKDFKPDIIHIHNIYHHLSPSILDVAAKHKIPVVMHLHDYKLISPDYNLLDNNISESGKINIKKYYRYLFGKAVKNSRLATGLAVLEMYLHHSVLKIYRRNISILIAPSRFMKEAVIAAGWPENKIKIVYNPYSPDLKARDLSDKQAAKNYLLYFGRLNFEKGIATLLEAAAITKEKVMITGIGPEEKKLKELAKKLGVKAEFTGFKSGTELSAIIQGAKAVVIPSIWPENMPLSLLEAMNLGKIIIASRIGGLPEMIEDEKTGLLFKPGDANDLARQIKNLSYKNQTEIIRTVIEKVKKLTPNNNLNQIIEIYKYVLGL
ncbi:MAG: glycosyltransferase [Patescibacteria group bacterium]